LMVFSRDRFLDWRGGDFLRRRLGKDARERRIFLGAIQIRFPTIGGGTTRVRAAPWLWQRGFAGFFLILRGGRGILRPGPGGGRGRSDKTWANPQAGRQTIGAPETLGGSRQSRKKRFGVWPGGAWRVGVLELFLSGGAGARRAPPKKLGQALEAAWWTGRRFGRGKKAGPSKLGGEQRIKENPGAGWVFGRTRLAWRSDMSLKVVGHGFLEVG